MAMDPELKALFKDFAKGVGVVIVLGLLVGLAIREPAMVWGKHFVDAVGGPGVAVVFFVLDLIWLPIPHDIFSGMALLGGMGFVETTLWASLGSVLGGSTGFFLCRKVGRTPWFERVTKGRGAKSRRAVEKWGTLGVVLGAISPLPYAPCCWVAGAFQMDAKVFLATTPLRIPRVAFYLWLIQVGLIETI